MQIILYAVECTRGAGEKVRELMEKAIIRKNQTVVLDFDGITGIIRNPEFYLESVTIKL